MLPTVLFILAAYSLFALVTVWSRRSARRLRYGRRAARLNWPVMGLGLLILAGASWAVLRAAPVSPPGGFSLAGVLGGLEVASLLPAKNVDAADGLPVKNPAPGDRPTYALLHPETPPHLFQAEKPAAPKPLRKPGLKGRPAAPGKKAKVSGKPPAKEKPEKAAAKTRVKKKPEAAPAKPAPIRQAYNREG